MTHPVRTLSIVAMMAGLILASCAKGPIGDDARLGQPVSLAETAKALARQPMEREPHCLRNTTRHAVQFEMRVLSDADWHRWILPPGQIMRMDRNHDPEIRFVSVPVATKSTLPGNEARLVHYRLDSDPPLRGMLPARSCLHEFRARPNGMLDLFLNSDLVS